MYLKKVYTSFIVVGVVFYATFIFSYLVLYLSNPHLVIGTDFVSFLTGASIIKSGEGAHIYDFSTQLSHQLNVILPYFKGLLPFRSPSIIALVFMPFLELNLRVASLLFVSLNTVVLLVIVWLLVRGWVTKAPYRYLVLLALLIYFPNINAIVIGQFTLFLTLLLTISFLALKKQKFFLAGLTIGLLAIKPQYLLIVPFLILISKRKITFIYGLALSILAVFLLSIAVAGLGPIFEYVPFLLRTESAAFGSRPYHLFTFYGNLQMLPLINSLPKQLLIAINFVFYGAALKVFASSVKKVPFELLFSVAILLTILFSIHALVHDLTNVLIVIFLLTALRNSLKSKYNNVLKKISIVLYLLPLTILVDNVFIAPSIILVISIYLMSIKNDVIANTK